MWMYTIHIDKDIIDIYLFKFTVGRDLRIKMLFKRRKVYSNNFIQEFCEGFCKILAYLPIRQKLDAAYFIKMESI